MSWQQPTGNYNPNAPSYTPGNFNRNAQPYNMQQGGGYGGYSPQQGGGYPPQQGGYNNQYGGYPPQQGGYNNQYGGYPPQQGGGYGGGYQQQGGYGGGYNNNNNYQQQQQRQQPAQQAPQQQAPAPAAPKTTAADAAKLSLGGGAASAVVLPKKKGGGTLSLGKKKKDEDSKATEAEAEVKAESSAAEGGSDATSKVASPTTKSSDDLKNRANMTPDELREAVRKEIARQREQSKKTYTRDPRPHFNVVFCGHVDAGKSTISGHLLMEKGLVDQREMDKLRREAENHHREGWEYAYVMDVSEDERSKGITRETGAAYFETEKRRVTVLDAPGHKAFVPSMIGGATQADICVLVISSRTGEFETGFEKGGQTREHAMLVRTCGVKQMICVINKMDEMNWSKERYDEIVGKLTPFLRQNGYDVEKGKNLVFIPIAGLTGENLIRPVDPAHCPWYSGPSMMDVVDNMVLPEAKTEDDVLCIPLVGGYKDDGKNYIYGKVESGSVAVGEKIQILPTKQEAVVEGISIEAAEFEKCYPGDNVHLRVRGVEENDIHGGYVATSAPTSMKAVEFFQARIMILEVRNIISAGSNFMLHIHAAQEEASIHKILAKVDKKTNEVIDKNPACAKAGDCIIARIEVSRPIVAEPHKDFDKMGRFMLRDDGKTIAIGVVTKLYESTREELAKAK